MAAHKSSTHSFRKTVLFTGPEMEVFRAQMAQAEDTSSLERVVYRALDWGLKHQSSKSPYSTPTKVHLQLRRGQSEAELWWNVLAPDALNLLRQIHPVFEHAGGGPVNSSGLNKAPYGVFFDQTTSPVLVESVYDDVEAQTNQALNEASSLQQWYTALLDALPHWYARHRGIPLQDPAMNVYREEAERLKQERLKYWVQRTNFHRGVPVFSSTSYANEGRIERPLSIAMLVACPLIQMQTNVGYAVVRTIDLESSRAIQTRCRPYLDAHRLLHGINMPSFEIKNILEAESPTFADLPELPSSSFTI